VAETEYHVMVQTLEEGLGPWAKKSFENDSPHFVDGTDIFSFYGAAWEKSPIKYRQRTPIQVERDRILYSQGMRKLTEKYHVLYNGQRRIVRSYATHTMKMAQVARAIARGLELNQDFAEAIALGAKVGAVPFVHAAKHKLSEWAGEKIAALDAKSAKESPLTGSGKSQLELDFPEKRIPEFVSTLKSSTVLDKIRRYMPWAAGESGSKLYGSGQEGYWLLCTNPFTNRTRRAQYCPETMYGIWRHSRGLLPATHPFHHKCFLDGASQGYHEITDAHATFESIIVQYADDITWVIENLNDANEVALLNDQQRSVYESLSDEIGEDVDSALQQALSRNDAGGIYSYFINDFITHSSKTLSRKSGGAELRNALTKGTRGAQIGLSSEADELLGRMVRYLDSRIFTEPRTKNRTEMLKSITYACVDLIYDTEVLPRVVAEQSRLGRWNEDAKKAAVDLLADDVHRTQASMDVLATWGDQEIYDFVGIQAL